MFDLFTILILNSIITFLFFVFLLNFIKKLKTRFFGLKYVMYGYLGYSLGVILLTLREYIPNSLFHSIFIGNIILFLGMLFLNMGIQRLFDIKEHFKEYALVFLFFCILYYYFTIINNNVSIRIILISSALVLTYFQSAMMLYFKSKKDGTHYYNSIISLLLLFALVNIIRIITTSINFNVITDFLTYSLDGVFHILMMVILFSLFIDILLIINKLLTKEVEEKLEENLILVSNLEALTQTDYLTGLFNRKALEEKTEQLISFCTQNRTSFHYILIDIDGFKMINDQHGHQFGDHVLTLFSGILRNFSDLIYRFGGDEFIILINDDNVNPKTMISQIKKECLKYEKSEIFIPSFSHGIHQWRLGETCADIIHTADQMMYLNKRECRT